MNYIIKNIRNMAAAVLFGLASIALVSPACAQEDAPSTLDWTVEKAGFKRFRDFDPEIRKKVLHLYMLKAGCGAASSDCGVAKCEKGRDFHKHIIWTGLPNADTTGAPLFESEDEAAEFGYRLAGGRVWTRSETKFSPRDDKDSRRKKVESIRKSSWKDASRTENELCKYLRGLGISLDFFVFPSFFLPKNPDAARAKDVDEYVEFEESSRSPRGASASKRKMKEEKKENRRKKGRK